MSYIRNITTINELQNLFNESPVVVVDFWAAWCGPCTQLKPKIQAETEQAKAWILAQVDVDNAAASALTQKFAVSAMPTVCLLLRNPDTVSFKFVGFNLQQLAELVKQAKTLSSQNGGVRFQGQGQGQTGPWGPTNPGQGQWPQTGGQGQNPWQGQGQGQGQGQWNQGGMNPTGGQGGQWNQGQGQQGGQWNQGGQQGGQGQWGQQGGQWGQQQQGPKCKAGHTLGLTGSLPPRYVGGRFTCDGCGKTDAASIQNQVWHCQACSFDLCRNCAGK